MNIPFLTSSDKHHFIGVDLDEEHIKIVHGRQTSLKREVAHVKSRVVHGLSDDEVGQFIRQTLDGWKLKTPKTYLVVPLYPMITRSIEIPSRDPAEIKEIVNLQASRHTPYSRAEIIIDTLAIGVVRENYTKVLLVIAPRDMVTRQTHVIEKAGLALEKVFFSPEGIALGCAKILSLESSDVVVALVHMDALFTSFIVTQKGKILFVRCIAIGATNLFEAREIYTDRFIDELRKSVDAYTTEEAGPALSELVLTGVVAEIRDLDSLFEEALQLPVKHQTYFHHFPISSEAKQDVQNAKHTSYFGAIAPLLQFDKMKVDLISEEQKLQKELQLRGREVLKTGVLVIFFVILLFSAFANKLYFRKAYLEKLTVRYAPARQEAKDMQELFHKTQAVKQYFVTRGRSIETLGELYEAIPMDVRVSDIRYEDGEQFNVKGTSRSMASVFAFVTNMEKSGWFKSVKTKYVTARVEGGIDVADFEITSVIGP